MYVIFLVITLFFLKSNTEKIDYCKINQNHVLCNANGSSVLSKKVEHFYPRSEEEKIEFLRTVNDLRNTTASGTLYRKGFVFPQASNMFQLEWCEECERAAFNLLRDCDPQNVPRNCCNCMNTGEMDLFAQILEIKNKDPVENDLKGFFDELFDSRKKDTVPFECIGNLTKECLEKDSFLVPLINARTVAVGCVLTKCFTKDNSNLERLVCVSNLDEDLDMINNPLYYSGTPCSKCVKEATCSEEYTNLCRCKERKKCLITPAPLKTECTTRASKGATTVPPTEIIQSNVTVKGLGEFPPAPVDLIVQPSAVVQPAIAQPPPATTAPPPTTETSGAGGSADTSGGPDAVGVDDSFIFFTLIVCVFAL